MIQLDTPHFDLSRPYVMGVLNVTPDSFSDGGRFSSLEAAVQRALAIQDEGADLLDLGGESTRPGSPRVSEEEELSRVLPVLKELSKRLRIPVSIDTYKANVAYAALQEGAALVNDISGLTFDPRMAEVVSQMKAPIILMHTRAKPEVMQQNVSYDDVFAEIVGKLKGSIQRAEEAGIATEKIIVDPGFGFGKRLEDNHELFRRLPELVEALQRPVLVGLSRKASLGLIVEERDPNQRLGASIAAATLAAYLGAHFIRAHDVRETVQAVKVASWLKNAPTTTTPPP